MEAIIESSPERSKHDESLGIIKKELKGVKQLKVLNSLLHSFEQSQKKETSPYAKTRGVRFPVVQLPQIWKKGPPPA